jgi:hypothetical protein
MTTAPTRARNVVLAALTGILVLADCGLAALGWMILAAERRGDLTRPESATFILVGASAVLGAVVMLIALVALARGPSGHRAARTAAALAWLRTAGRVIALVAVTIWLGAPAIAGLLPTPGAVIALIDAVIALIVTGVAERRTRHG